MNKSGRRALGLSFLLATTIAWGTSVILLKQTIDTLPPLYVLAMRFALASVLILICFGKRLKGMSKGTLARGIILGAVLAAAYAVQTIGLQYTSASRNAFITGSYCIMCPFLAWLFLKNRPRYHSVIAAVLCVAGLAMIAFAGGEDSGWHFLGDGFTLVAAIGYAAQIIMIYSFQHKHHDDPIKLLVLEICTVCVMCTVFSACVEIPVYGIHSFAFGWQEGWRILYLGVICTLIAQMAQMIGQRYTSPAQAGMVLSLESVFGVVFAMIIGHEKVSWFLAGAFIIIFVAQLLSALAPWIDEQVAKRKATISIQEGGEQPDPTEQPPLEQESSPLSQDEN